MKLISSYKSLHNRNLGFIKILLDFVFLLSIAVMPSCKKLVEVSSPGTSLTSENVYKNDATATAVLTGIYTKITLPSPLSAGTIDAISLISALSADELTLY